MHVSILLSTFAIARILMWSTPHKQRARMYVQAQPTLYNRCGLIFLPVTFRIHGGVRPLFMWSTPHSVEMQIKIYGGSPSTCFFALCGGSHESSSRRGSASRFFRTLSSTAPDGFGHKARTLIICKQLHQFSAQLICAR